MQSRAKNEEAKRRLRLKEIAKGADNDVAGFDRNGNTKTVNAADELNGRQMRLREKLDTYLEIEYQKMFGRQGDQERKKKRRTKKQDEICKERDSNEDSGIRLFKHIKIGMPNASQTPTPVQTYHKRRKRKKPHPVVVTSHVDDGIHRFKGLAVLDTDDILEAAEKIRQKGKRNLETTPASDVLNVPDSKHA